MKKKIYLHTSLLLGLVLFIIVLRYVGLESIADVFQSIHPEYLIFYGLVSATIFLGYVYRWYRILRVHGYKISFGRLFLFRTAGYAVSYLTPSAKLGGEPLKAYLLCREKVDFKNSFSSVILDKTIELTANGLFTTIGILYVLTSFAIPENAKIALYFTFFFWIIFMVGFYVRALNGHAIISLWLGFPVIRNFNIVKKNIDTIKDGEARVHHFFRKNKKEFFIALTISLLLWFMMLLEFKLLFLLFGYSDLSLVQIFLVGLMVGVSYAIPIPAALGVLEAGQASLFKILRNQSSVGLAIGLITRFRDMIWTIIGLSYLYIKGVSFIGKKTIFRKRDKSPVKEKS